MLIEFKQGLQISSEPVFAYYFVYCDQTVLGKRGVPTWQPFTREQWLSMELGYLDTYDIGTLDNTPCIAVDFVSEQQLPTDCVRLELRPLLNKLEEQLFFMLGRGLQIIEWCNTHRFCGQCGGLLVNYDKGRARHCISCEKSFYPRVSPCIIVLVTRGEELLLANGVRHRPGVYSTVAGFIEPGETAEQAVHREVMEELGVEIKNLRYQCSQPWPFPHQLMLGYFAEYKAGEIVIEEEEINDARWWHYKKLPPYPEKSTISGVLIDTYLQKLEKSNNG